MTKRWLCSQHQLEPHAPVTLDPRDWAPSSGLIDTRHTGGAHICRQNTCTHKINTVFCFKVDVLKMYEIPTRSWGDSSGYLVYKQEDLSSNSSTRVKAGMPRAKRTGQSGRAGHLASSACVQERVHTHSPSGWSWGTPSTSTQRRRPEDKELRTSLSVSQKVHPTHFP